MAFNRFSSRAKFILWLLIAAVVFTADQTTKALIMSVFHLGESKGVVTGFFNMVRVHNTGAAFSFMASEGGGNAGSLRQ